MTCASCGRTNRADARFCDGCGAPLAARPADGAEARKVVTIVFADLIGSTSLHERLDPESTRRLMDRYYRTVRAPVEALGGTVVQLLGDGVMCAFGVPRVAEDDAIRAVRAAVGIQQAFREFARDEREVAGAIGMRVAVNTGEVVVGDEHAAVGDPLNVAARLQQEAHDGDVLIGESTQRLVGELVTLEPFGVLALRGRAETVAAYRVVSLDRPAGALTTPFVGREDELRRITAIYDAAVASRRARLAVILGSPGLGKSRLIAELVRRLGDRARVVTAHCDAAGGASFAPLAEALRTLLRIDEGAAAETVRAAIAAVAPGDPSERARTAAGVAALIGGTPGSPEETFFVVRRLLAALAAAQPLVLAIDDLQWAEPLLLDLIEHLVHWTTDAPLLVLGAGRPELREVRASLAAPGPLVHGVVTLAGLDAGAAARLAASVIGAEALPAAVAGRVLATSEGNPLFVGELVRMLVHDGALRREGDRWVTGVELADLEMPPTIQALLAARIERLAPEERTILERAAVVGRQFSRAAVVELLPPEVAAEVDGRLEALRRSELIEPDPGLFLGEPGLRFHHVLIRDAAYRRLLKGTRAELHGRFADWLERRVGAAVEHGETIGWHLEQAHQHLRELGPLDEHGRALGERAARYLAAAGRRALARDDVTLAASLLGRAIARLDPADPARADLALDWCEALLAAGDVGPAAKAIAELDRLIGGSQSPATPAPNPQPLTPNPRLQAWRTCFAGQLAVLTDPQALRATTDAVAAAADRLAAAGDAAGEAKAHSVHALALARLGTVGASEAALDRALAAARRAGDRRRANAVLAGAPLAALWGPSPVTRASGRCLDVVRVLRITQDAPAVEAVALRCQGVLEALRGRSEAARRMIASSRRMVEELGITQRLLEADVFAGLVELLEGDAPAAEHCLRAAYEGLRELGLGIDAAQAAALLGRALLAQDRAAEAEALSHDSEALAGDDLKAAIAWRGVRAEALARRGEHGAAVALARAAVDLAAATDALLDHADARLALAAALRAAGRSADAAAEEARAAGLWEAKGATLLAERAAARVGSVGRLAADLATARSGVTRRVRANTATANLARMDAAVADRDLDAFFALLADGSESVHHQTGMVAADRAGLRFYEILFSAENLTFEHEPLATLGEALALALGRVSFTSATSEGDTFGAANLDSIVLAQVDAHGRRVHAEFFALDRLAAAVMRLYERFAELVSDGAARRHAAATARSAAALLGPPDLDRYGTAFAPDIEFVDHRSGGFPPARGSAAVRRHFGILFELASDVTVGVEDILCLDADGLLVRWRTAGTERAGGGAYARDFLLIWRFGSDGLVTRIEHFDTDRAAAALVRFDALASGPSLPEGAVPAPPERGARRSERRYGRRLAANAACANAALCDEPLAALGESLALCRARTSFGGPRDDVAPSGAFEAETLVLIEADANGRRRTELFAPDRLGDALARLYALHAELCAEADRARAAVTARSLAAMLGPFELDRYATGIADDVEFIDHRTVGFPPGRGVDELLRSIGTLLDSADDVATRVDDVLAARPDALLLRWTTSGKDRLSGGPFEWQFLRLLVFGAHGLLIRAEQFDVDREAAALARFDELAAAPAGPAHLTNAATLALARMADAAGLRVLATRGERLALARGRLAGSDRSIGSREGESLLVLEVDDRGDRVALATFEAADLQAAYAELDERYAAAAAVDHQRAAVTRTFTAAFAARDFDKLATVLAPDLVVTDHRLLGWEVLHGPAAYVQALRSLVDLAPDVQLRIDHIRMSSPGFLYITTWLGTRDGGTFEAPSAIVCEVDEAGRIRRFDQYDLDRLDEARAHLASIAGRAQRDAGAVRSADMLRIPHNRATLAFDRWQRCLAAENWEALQELYAPALVWDDRRRFTRVTGNRDMAIASTRYLAERGTRIAHAVLATAGDRLALERVNFTRPGEEAAAEVTILQIIEVDAEDRIAAAIAFDPDDRRAASVEMRERFARSDGASAIPAGMFELARAIEARDPARMRAALPPDYVFHDHRRTGVGRLESAADYVASAVALFEHSPDVATEDLYQLAVGPHGGLSIARTFGTLADGGAFESIYVRLQYHPNGRWVASELFELDDLPIARARLDELRRAS